MKKIKNLKYVIAMMMMALFVSLGNTNNVDAAAKLKVHFVDVMLLWYSMVIHTH